MSRRQQFADLRAEGPVVLPSLLLCDFGHLADELARLEEGGCKALHLDVMDGHFVPNLTYGLTIVEACRRLTELPLDVHLMTRTTSDWIERAVVAGATRLAIHAEFCADVEAALQLIEALGATPVLVLPLEAAIGEGSLPWGVFRRVLLMGTEIGIKGMGLDPRVPGRIR